MGTVNSPPFFKYGTLRNLPPIHFLGQQESGLPSEIDFWIKVSYHKT